MKKLKKIGSLVALSTGLLVLGGVNAHAQTPYDSIKEQFKNAESHGAATSGLTKSNSFQPVLKSTVRKDLTGNVYYESEPNDYIYDANLLNRGDVVVGTSDNDYDVDVYEIQVPQDEQIGIYASMANKTSSSDIAFLLYDVNDNPVQYIDYQDGDHSWAELYDLPAGTYYIKALNPTGITTGDTYGLAWDVYTPDTTPPVAPTVNKVYDNSSVVTGVTEPNATIKVYLNGSQIGSSVADSNGNFTTRIPVESAGSILNVTATDLAGNVSQPTQVTVTKAVLNGWVTVNGKRYYYINNVKQTGWLQLSGKWYYLGKTTGIMATGWLYDGGNWYYLNGSGKMLTGWQKINGKWYYFYSNGKMAHDTKIGKDKLGHNGAMI
jgi:hypothetical protein